MRGTRLLSIAAVCLFLAPAVALAASQTVSGKGDLRKMTAKNGSSAVTVKLYGFKGPCVARQFAIIVFWSTKPQYDVQAGCTGGTKWTSGLYYNPDRRDGSFGQQKVRCSGFSLKYTASGNVWTAIIPRKCISKAANRVRVRAEGINYSGSALPGVAGPTRLLARG